MGIYNGWNFWRAISRRKILDSLSLNNSELARVLNTFDLTALGVGSTLGVGVYVLAGNVAKNIAGPAVVLSFLIAAIASVFAGLCYAEFGARVPRAGSAYVYSYVSVGEFIAFIIGWNLILEYVIGSASVAKGLSKYLDSLMNETMEHAFLDSMPMDPNSLAISPYFDMFAFCISIILAVALALGVKESSLVNNVFTIINIGVVLFVIIAGPFKADTNNWKLKDVPKSAGEGGFLPFGISGAIKGAATCFYGFVGFDCVATTGEEVRNPQKAIPIAIITSLTIIFLSYFGVSMVLTLMWPYYLQDSDAPIPKVFDEVGWPVGKWIVTIGGLFGLCASLFGAMFPLPRIIYAMAMDGLIFRFLGQVHKHCKTPAVGTLIAGVLTGLMAAIFNLDQLVNMMSIGTLLAYTIVAACVLLLRYKAEIHEETEGYTLLPSDLNDNGEEIEYKDIHPYGVSDDVSSEYIESTNLMTLEESVSFSTVSKQLFNPFRLKHPTSLTSNIVAIEILVFGLLSMFLCLCVIWWNSALVDLDPWALSVTSIIAVLLVLTLLSVSMQPTSVKPLSFKVPFVPVIPALSILINIYLMLMLDADTWIRFGIWMAIGFIIYFLYGVKKSKAPYKNKLAKELQPTIGQFTEGVHEESRSLRKENGTYLPYGLQTSKEINNNILLHQESVQKENILKNMDDDDLKKSIAYIDDLERILDYNDMPEHNTNVVAMSNNVYTFTDNELENNKNAMSLNHNDNVLVYKSGEGSLVSNVSLSKTSALSASVVSTPANVSLSSIVPPESTKRTNASHVRRIPSESGARNLYPNIIVVSHDSESEDKVPTKHNQEDIPNLDENVNVLEIETQMQTNPNDSNVNTDDSESNFRPQTLPPPPPPPPPPFSFSLPHQTSQMSATNKSKTSNTYKTISPDRDSSNSTVRRSTSENDYDTNGSETKIHAKSKTEPATPVAPNTEFLLRVGSFKTSDFANKLEAVLMEKLSDIRNDTTNTKSPLFTKNSMNSNNNSNNTEKIKHRWTVISMEPNTKQNENKEVQNNLVTKNVVKEETNEKLTDRETERANIKGKLEQFFANRSEASVLQRPSSHPNLVSLTNENGESATGENEINSRDTSSSMKFKIDPSTRRSLINKERDSEKAKLDRENKLKLNSNNNFDTVRKQRLLMGEVLASIKFVASKSAPVSRADSEVGSVSDNSEDDEEVFDDSTKVSKVSINLKS